MSTTMDSNDGVAKLETFDDILPHIGSTGRYQKFLIIMLMPFFCSSAFLFYSQLFTTLIPEEHWCKVPELDNANLSDWTKIELSIPPRLQNGDNVIPYSQCKMYIANYTEVLITGRKPGPETPIDDCKYGWSFNQSNIPYLSIAAELEWVCDKAYLSSTAQSAFFMGSIVGALIFGYIADHYGRLPAHVACNAVGFFASIATAFTNSFWTFAIARFIVGTSFDNCYNIIFIIVIEYVAPKYRTLVTNMCFGLYFAFGASLMPWLAFWISNWKLLSFYTALPLAIAFITPWIIPESARWYVQKGRADKAIEILKRFAKVNKKFVKPDVYEQFKKNCDKLIKDDKSGSNYTVFDLFKLSRLRRITVTLITCWLLINLIFVGLIWNIQLLHPDVFVSYSLASISEPFAAITLTIFLDKWGRRWMGLLSMLICGVFSFVVLIMPIGTPAMCIAILARFGINVAANINYQYAAEILPTVVRAQGISLIHILGFFTSLIGPYVVQLATVHESLPFLVVGSLAFLTAILMLMLPETMDQKLPESLEEGNDFGREQSFWWFPCVSYRSPVNKKRCEKTVCVTNPDSTHGGSLNRVESTSV